jgi:diguanylate cyclase (GGDEF)-like protein
VLPDDPDHRDDDTTMRREETVATVSMKKSSAATTVEPSEGIYGSDPELVHVLLNVHRYLEIPQLLDALIEPVMRWCGAELAVGLAPIEEDRRRLAPVAASTDLDDDRVRSIGRAEVQRLKRWLARGKKVFDGFGPFEAIVTDWRHAAPRALVALPVAGPVDEWAGVLLLLFSDPPEESAVARAKHLLRMARPAIANALRLLSVHELVIKDDTARCFNRRHFEEFLPEELARASRFRSPVSLIFLDLDNLKQVNNRFGHSMGSRTLYEVSVRVRSRIRKFDKLFRFGGDEFCIVLPETEWHGAMEVAERVRDAVASKPFLVRDLGDKKGIAMSASLGIASFPLHARHQRELVQLADRAMQKVKNSGKNAIGVAEIVDDGEEAPRKRAGGDGDGN